MEVDSRTVPIFTSREQLEAYVTRGVYPVRTNQEENVPSTYNMHREKYNRAIRKNVIDVSTYNSNKRKAEKEREKKIIYSIHRGRYETANMTSAMTTEKNANTNSKIPLSQGEIETIHKQENAKRRALRIKQVRDHEKLYAARLVRLRQQQVATKHAKVVAKKRQAWEEERERDLNDLQGRYKIQVASIGSAQKQASRLVGIQADEARKNLRVWELSNSVNDKRHSKAVVTEKNADSDHKRKIQEANQRTETRYNEQQVQRFKAHQYKAAIDEAKSRRVESHTVEVDYSNTDVVREIIAPVQTQGSGIVDFSKTHFHHAVTRHRAAQGPQRSTEKVEDEIQKGANENRSELQVGISRGPMISGVDGAINARKAQIERQAKQEADAALARERARQRARVAAEKIRMEEEYRTISDQLKVLDMSNRAARLKAFQLTQRNRAGNTVGTKPIGAKDIDAAAEDSFEREFIDGKASFELDDSNAEFNNSGDMKYAIKEAAETKPETNIRTVDDKKKTQVKTVIPTVEKDSSATIRSNGSGAVLDNNIDNSNNNNNNNNTFSSSSVQTASNVDGRVVKKIHISRTGSVEVSVERPPNNESPTRTMMQISQGLSQLAGELNDASVKTSPAKTNPDDFYQSYLQKYTKDTATTSDKISQARQQMRRDRALAAKNKEQMADDDNDNNNDDIFMFKVGSKGQVIDAERETTMTTTTTTTTTVDIEEEEGDDEESMARRAAAAAVVATHHKITMEEEEDEYVNTGGNDFSTDSLGLMPGDLDLEEDPVKLLKEAELALAEAENVTSGGGSGGDNVTLGDGVQAMLDQDDQNFKSALDEANDVLRELDEMTKVEITRELNVVEDTNATATVTVPRAQNLNQRMSNSQNNEDGDTGKWKTKEEEIAEVAEAERIRKAKKGMVWEVKVGDGSGAKASTKATSLNARLKKGEKPKIAIEEARKRSKKNSSKANKRAKMKSAQAIAREKEKKRRAVLERRQKAKEADKARRALLGKKQVKIPTASMTNDDDNKKADDDSSSTTTATKKTTSKKKTQQKEKK